MIKQSSMMVEIRSQKMMVEISLFLTIERVKNGNKNTRKRHVFPILLLVLMYWQMIWLKQS